MKIGRSAKTGRFTTVEKARRLDETHVVETIKPAKPAAPPAPPQKRRTSR